MRQTDHQKVQRCYYCGAKKNFASRQAGHFLQTGVQTKRDEEPTAIKRVNLS